VRGEKEEIPACCRATRTRIIEPCGRRLVRTATTRSGRPTSPTPTLWTISTAANPPGRHRINRQWRCLPVLPQARLRAGAGGVRAGSPFGPGLRAPDHPSAHHPGDRLPAPDPADGRSVRPDHQRGCHRQHPRPCRGAAAGRRRADRRRRARKPGGRFDETSARGLRNDWWQWCC